MWLRNHEGRTIWAPIVPTVPKGDWKPTGDPRPKGNELSETKGSETEHQETMERYKDVLQEDVALGADEGFEVKVERRETPLLAQSSGYLVTSVTVGSTWTVPNPGVPHSNLKPSIYLTADVLHGLSPVPVVRDLQRRVDAMLREWSRNTVRDSRSFKDRVREEREELEARKQELEERLRASLDEDIPF